MEVISTFDPWASADLIESPFHIDTDALDVTFQNKPNRMRINYFILPV